MIRAERESTLLAPPFNKNMALGASLTVRRDSPYAIVLELRSDSALVKEASLCAVDCQLGRLVVHA